jgi:streptomycin 6-kinase
VHAVAFESSPIERYRSKADWDATAADLVRTMLERWHLIAGEPYLGGEAASVLRVTTADGTPAVLKVGFPHLEGVWEAVGLEVWGPGLAPAVLRQDAWTWSLLLERIEPGTPLSRAGLATQDALELATELYREMSRSPVPSGVLTLREVADVYLANAWARLPSQAAELARLGARELLERGLEETDALAATDGGSVLLHGDFNPGNLITADHGLRVIDPKPMAGDAEFDLFPLIEQLGTPLSRPHALATVERRLLDATRIIGCDAARTARWCFARSALNLSWWLEDGNHAAAVETVPELRLWRELSGV